MDVQSMQREVLIKMLHPPGEDTALTWKVLIFDDRCMKVLSSLFHVQQLQKHGVTIMMRIGEKRERIEDTPAVYFIEPTTENIATVARDCKMGLYDSVQLNFCRPLSQKLMQELARQTIQGGIHRKITRVYDQYSDFVSVSSRLVSLGMTNSFAKLTRPVSEKALMNYVDRVVDSLFSIVVTLQQVPIIRCAPGNAAALTAQRLHSKLREHLMSRNNLFSGTGATSYRRPLLILLDRNIDLSVPLHHPWSYCALVNDIFGITSHKVDIPVEEQGSTKMKTYDLTSEDEFWEEYQGAAFPQVAEGVQKYLNEYNERSKELKKDGVDLTDLKSAVNSMPELMRKKRVIDAHTNIATALLKHLKDRQWDRFFELEEELINRVPPSAEDMLKEIQPEAKGTPTDKLRLYLIYSLCHNVKPEDAQAMEKTLQGYASPSADSQYPKLDLSALSFLKTFKMEQKVTSRLTTHDTKTSKVAKESEQRSLFSYLSSTVGARGKKLLQGVRNLIPTDKSLPITKLVESMMENKDSKDTARFLYYDPKLLQTKGPIAGSSRITTSFSEGIVFVMGGGNYVEYQNLQDYAKRASNLQSAVSIAYGSTEIFSGEQFLAQLSSLGKAPTGSDVDDLLD